MPNFSRTPALRFCQRLVKQGVLWFLVALLALLAPVAQAQSDTTVPAITLNAADGSTNFTSLPSPLTGSVFDAGGMGGLVTVRFYRNHNGTWERWAAGSA